ncbi:TonB-dependent receptor [Azoarcus sp. DD4]|uniref:TonB-dependent receptor plug domain-containing protein n=1 Tax=Azoarcus sp. DD4 TaxID=2027405 RepID=UPI001128EBC4|nr:TonB-dependent receptor [Azoarcus sp. DD4]QDF99420.1 TonB-dependent receptor [Azoarcus sp. DD4]
MQPVAARRRRPKIGHGLSKHAAPAGLLLASLGALPGAAAAAGSDDIFFSELPIVATVSRLPQRLADASASVTVIDRDMIKASGARDLNDVFRLVPGFQTYPNNTDAARVTYHGLTDEDFSPRVQVLIDGRSQYSPLFRNGVNWATLPVALEDIERIEVVRGSNAVSYGSNAFLGVINIITVDPALVRGTSISTNIGNQGVRDLTLRRGGRLGEAGDYRLTYQSKKDDGLRDQFDWKDSFQSRLLDLRTDLWLTNRDQLQLSLGHVDAVVERGRLAREDDVLTGGDDPENPLRDFTQSDTYLQALWRHALEEGADFQLRYSYTESRGSDAHTERYDTLLFDIDEMGDLGTRHELEAQHSFAPGASTRLVWGGSYRLDSLSSDHYLADRDTVYRRVARIFGNLEWKPATWLTTNLGAATEYDSMAGRNFSPRISTSFHLNPENTIRIGASRAYRSGATVDYVGKTQASPYATSDGSPLPSFRYLDLYGDADMPQEKITTVELGYLGEWAALRSSLDVRLFRERIPNRMQAIRRTLDDPALCDIPTPDHCTFPYYTTPIQRVKIEGVEYQWRWQPFNTTRILLGQSWIRIKADYLADALNYPGITTLDDPRQAGRIDAHTEQSAPERSTSLLLMQKLPGNLDFSLAGYWVDHMKWTRNSAVDFYRRFDMRLGYPFDIGGQRGEIAYTAQSINGKHGEFKASGDPADRVVELRHWVSLRIDL